MSKNFASLIPQRLRTPLAFGVLVLLALPTLAAAQDPLIPSACRFAALQADASGCTICHLAELVVNITKFLMYYVALPSIALLVAIGGIMLLIAGPSEPLRNRGKEILKATVIGVIIVFLGWILVDTIIKVATNREDSSLLESIGPWNDFDVEACAGEI